VAFEDLYWLQTSLIINVIEDYYSENARAAVYNAVARRRRQGHLPWGGDKCGGVDVTTDA